MRNSQVYQVLNGLHGKDINRLESMLESPFFNPRSDVLALLKLYKTEIKKQRPGLSKEEVSLSLFKKENVSDQVLRTLYSNLYALVNKFLFYKYAEQDEFFKSRTLIKAYAQIGKREILLKNIYKAKKRQVKQVLRDAEHHRRMMHLEQEEYDYKSELTRSGDNNLQVLTDTLDVYYFSQKLKQACLMTIRQLVYKQDYDLDSFKHCLQYIDSKLELLDLHPSIALYYYCYCAMIRSESENYFRLFREEIEKTKHQFDKDEVRLIYLLAINYCIKRLNAGEGSYVKESFELYKAGIENDSLLTNNTLSHFTYKNVVALGLGLKHYEWVENFIQEYKKNLNVKQRESSYTFNLAKLRQEQGNYTEAMSLLIHYNHDDPLMSLAAKTNLLKMYFELQEYESLESLLNSMETYLSRKKVLSYHKKHYKNIIRFTKKMIKLPPYAKEAHQKLREEIEKADMRSEKEWFIAQLA